MDSEVNFLRLKYPLSPDFDMVFRPVLPLSIKTCIFFQDEEEHKILLPVKKIQQQHSKQLAVILQCY